jgi:hypothetical protein
MNRPSENQFLRVSFRRKYSKKLKYQTEEFKLIALPFLALQRKELFFKMTRSQ